MKSLIISIFFHDQNIFLNFSNRLSGVYSRAISCKLAQLIAGGLEIILVTILCNFRAVFIHCIFVRSNGGNINFVSHHLEYHIIGNHRESALRADNQNVSRKFEGMRRY